jgi:hypothetical protein
MIDLYRGDCLEVMDELIEKGVVVDSIITDRPCGPSDLHTLESVVVKSQKYNVLSVAVR